MDPRKTRVIAIVIVVLLVVAGIGLYYFLPKTSTGAKVLKIDQAEIPDTLDPHVTFSTPGWAAVEQVYQGLVNYNGTSSTEFAPVLAQNWTHSSDFMHWNFTLRAGIHFSNGDPMNAYVLWYSLYRSLLLEQGPQFILEQNFFSPDLSAPTGLNYYSDLATMTAANTTLVNDLNTWDFTTPSSAALTAMQMQNQSFRVLDVNTIQLNVGFGYLGMVPYTYLLATLASPSGDAVDPKVVDANGGIQEGQVNNWMASNTVGTGPYLIQSYSGVQGGGYTLAPDANYWGHSVPAGPTWNTMIQPANTTIQLIFQNSLDITTNDLITGAVQEASFAYVGPSTITALQGHSNLNVQALPDIFGATGGSWWIYLDQSVFPFNNLSVREAIAHAIDYKTIVAQAFGGFATQWVGPVPPSYPYYNPQNLPTYPYDLALAQQEIANSPCAANACAGTSYNYAYLDSGLDWSATAQFLVGDLAKIGITINPVPISIDNLYVEQSHPNGVCVTSTAANGGPFHIGQEFYTSDYISPDDWTQNNAYSGGSANQCMSHYSNLTVDNLVYAAASETNPTNLTADYSTITNLMYYNYTDIWLTVPTAFAVYATNVHGIQSNPMGSAEPYVLLFNTQYLS